MDKSEVLDANTHEMNLLHARVHQNQYQVLFQTMAEKSAKSTNNNKLDTNTHIDTNRITNMVNYSQHVRDLQHRDYNGNAGAQPSPCIDNLLKRNGFSNTTAAYMLQHQSTQASHSNYTILPHNTNNCNSNNTKLVQEPLGGALHTKIKPRNKNEEAISDLLLRIPDVDRTFDVHNRIGNGTFSTVLLATLKRDRLLPELTRRKFAIKHHIPTSHPDRILKELQCMKKMGGVNNVVGINCCLRCEASVAFVMPYMQHDRFHDFFIKMKPAEVRFYMRNLFIALRHVHSFDIIHRDVKPSNFLYNRRMQQFLLVDFGLAQHVPTSATASEQTVNRTQLQQAKLQLLLSQESTQSESNAITSCEPSVVAGQKRLPENDDLQQQEQDGPNTAKRYRKDEHGNEAMAGFMLISQQETKMPLKQINAELTSACVKTSETTTSEIKVLETTKIMSVEQQLETLDVSLAAQAETVACGVTTMPAFSNAINNNNRNNTNRNSHAPHNTHKCYCYGNSTVCNVCLVKREVHASRAGTPGYRPPEVLLKYPDQTTAVDVWAAGVIFLSILSSVYPFFKAPNDYLALAEIITIFGDKTIRRTAFALDRLLTLSQRAQPLDLQKLCVRFRNRAIFSSSEMLKRHQQPDGSCEICKNCDQYFFNCLCLQSSYKTEPYEEYDIFPSSAYDLLYRLLEVNPHKRITADQALKHPFLCERENDAVIKTDATSLPVANANTQKCVSDNC